MFLLEYSRIVQQCSEISSWNVFLLVSARHMSFPSTDHGEVDVIFILESIEQSHEPRRLDGTQDISLDQNMLHLVHLGQSALSHLFQSTHFACVRLSSKIHGTITTLSDLSDNSELVESKLCSSLSKEDSFSSIVGCLFLDQGISRDLRVN